MLLFDFISDSEFFLENLERIETKKYSRTNYTVNPKNAKWIFCMANSTSTGFEKAKKYVKKMVFDIILI